MYHNPSIMGTDAKGYLGLNSTQSHTLTLSYLIENITLNVNFKAKSCKWEYPPKATTTPKCLNAARCNEGLGSPDLQLSGPHCSGALFSGACRGGKGK